MFVLLCACLLSLLPVGSEATKTSAQIHTIHWNSSNPMFKSRSGANVIDINGGNHPWEYDQVNIVCPVYKPSSTFKNIEEQYIIYSVSKAEFDSCRITQPEPKIVALCNRPHELMYFTITFRSFTPTPGGLEFRPGHDYYFISTSSPHNLHRRVGGGCGNHNMKVVFRVAPNEAIGENEPSEIVDNGVRGERFPWSKDNDYRRSFSYYYPTGEIRQSQEQLQRKSKKSDSHENESLPLQSASTRISLASCLLMFISILFLF